MNYLAENMAEFFNVLRTAGMNISISDSITAVEALQYVDVTNRMEVKAALSACMAKSGQEREIFSKAFDLFFVPYEVRKQYINSKAEMIEKRKEEIEAAAATLKFQDKQLELSDDFKEIFAGIPEEERKGLEYFLNATSAGKNVRAEFKLIAENMIKGKLSALKQKYNARLSKTFGALSLDSSEAGIIAGEVSETALSAEALLRKNIGEISEEDVPAVIRLISTLVDKLKKDLSRKYRTAGKRTRLDIKRTIRSNLTTGQVMFRLKYKNRSRSKTKMLLLCDVSASMLRFSSFVLQFMAGMGSGFSSIESNIFSDELEKINIKAFFGIKDFEEHVKGSSIWGKGTNIGRALGYIIQNRFSPVSSSTVLVIVSDAKTLDYDLFESNLKELSTKVKRILWLNPVPEKDWSRIKGIEALLKYCTILDCSSLERLASACSKL